MKLPQGNSIIGLGNFRNVFHRKQKQKLMSEFISYVSRGLHCGCGAVMRKKRMGGSGETKSYSARLPLELIDAIKVRSKQSGFRAEAIVQDALRYALVMPEEISSKRLAILREIGEKANKAAEQDKPPKNKANH